jgi:MoaA/NifB/PqqE/SkfB family radical SAM enzyme
MGVMADATLPQSAYGTHPRRFITLAVTHRCNLKCRHCSDGPCPREVAELSPEAYVRFVRGAWDVARDFHVQITGGEPLLRLADCLAIIRELSRDGIYTHLVTNGTLLRDGVPEALADAGLSSLAVSVDGFAATHDWLRGVPGSWERARAALARMEAVADRVRVSVATVLFDRLLPDVEPFAREMLRLPYLSHVNFQVVFPDLKLFPGGDFHANSDLWPRKFGKAVAALDRIEAMKREGLRIKNPLTQLDAMRAYFAEPTDLFRGRCNADREVLHVASNGDLRVCVYHDALGNLADTTYADLLASPAWAKALRELAACRVNCHSMVNCCYSET